MCSQKWPTTTDKYAANEILEALAPFLPGSSPTSLIELTLKCENLRNTNIVGKLDPFCKILMKEQDESQFKEIARTEVIKDTSSPEWVEKVVLNYNFESAQRIRFEICDADEKDDSDQLGYFQTTISELVSFSGKQSVGQLQGTSSRLSGQIVIVTEEVKSCKQVVEIEFHAESLENHKWFGSINPFLVLSRSNADGSYSVVAKTETVYSSEAPAWKSINIRATALCNGDFQRNIKIDCYDHQSDGSHQLLGTAYTSLFRLDSSSGKTIVLVDESANRIIGKIYVQKIAITEEFTFLDYIRSGTQMHFAVAIDFTASNGTYTDPKSLHYRSTIPNELNQYEVVLRGIGEIIEYYDRAKIFPAFGTTSLA